MRVASTFCTYIYALFASRNLPGSSTCSSGERNSIEARVKSKTIKKYFYIATRFYWTAIFEIALVKRAALSTDLAATDSP
jgi:hypothetical protein